jgi:c-di-GMP-binding flagellar brake protein YcgR
MSTPPIIAPAGVRRSPRFRANFAIKLFAVVQQRRCVLQGRSHDVSTEGMAIYIPAEFQKGQAVQIEFVVPETNQRLGINAVVRDSHGFRCGVEFQNLTPVDEAALRRLCEKLASEPAENKFS